MILRQKGRLLLLLGGAVFLSGCVRGDRTDCEFPLRLRFSYTNNVPAEELFQKEVASLDLFFYDSQSGVLVYRDNLLAVLNDEGEIELPLAASSSAISAEETLPGENDGENPGGEDGDDAPDDGGEDDMPLPGEILKPLAAEYALQLPPGRYDVVAWGGVRERYSYVGTYKLDEAFVYANRREESDLKIIDPDCEPLFYGTMQGLDISGDATGEHVLHLRQNTNNIRIVVTGLTENHRTRLESTMSALNGAYAFYDNRCLEKVRTIYYPTPGSLGNAVIRDFRMLRLWEGDESHLTVRVAPEKTETPENPDGPENPAQRAAADADKSYTIFDGCLSELLMLCPHMDFDRVSDYTIEFRMGSLGDGDDGDDGGDVEPGIPADVEVTVLINDWVVIEQNTDLG